MTPTLTHGTMDATQYKKKTPIEHILDRPDSYIGSREAHQEHRWTWNAESKRMEWREVTYNPGLYKIFDELVVNALDHVIRQSTQTERGRRVTQIVVTVNPTVLAVQNDGDGIPVTMHPEEKVMIPELIFGHLLTSSNYDDEEEKVVGGKNGYGAKLANVYSREFVVRTCDTRFVYEQTFTNNMRTIGRPTMKKCAGAAAKPFTEIRASPEIERFFPGLSEIPADMLAVLRTRVIDAAALAAAHGCRVFLAGSVGGAAVHIPVASFEQYARLFAEDDVPIFYEKAGERWEVAAVLSRHLHADGLPDDRHISFVNGIFTRRGGKHVDTVARTVLAAFCEGPGKKLDLKPAQLKDALTFFVNSTIVNPSFESQSKETLTTAANKFGSVFKVSEAFVKRLAKDGGLLEEAQAVLDAKMSREAKKVDGRKTSSVRGIPKLEDATWAGTGKSAECTLILTEGDSAASTAISGLKVVGRERFGVFPLKGKVLNVKDASEEKKNDNEELTRIKKILGLQHGRKYTAVSQLRYGRVMIMTDQDVDGSHIKGLLINLFHTEWPALLELGFLCCLMTPLLKATRGAKTLCFYSSSEYDKWLLTPESNGGRGWHVKYYKGLGTSTAAEAREYFTSMNTVDFLWDEESNDHIDLAFNKKRADDRKEWLTTYDRDRVIDVPAGGARVSYTRFVNDELIHFSNADNLRSLPHVMDGLKPSQRKILWAARKRNLVSEIKVAQLAGYVSETAAYHHGETSLTGAIVGMAQNFVGSNNINLLAPNGQFGTRLQGGADAASPRYIFTALEPVQSALLHKADDPALSWLEDDGQKVEPEYYMPTLPLLLVNGAIGIGTGFSTDIIGHNPADIVSAIRRRLDGSVADLTETKLVPWWDGFRGTVSVEGRKVITKGCYEFLDDDTHRVRITELPIGVWTKDYKVFLENMLAGEPDAKGKGKPGAKAKKGDAGSDTASSPHLVKSYQENYNDVDVEFVVHLEPEYYHEARTFPKEFEKRFKLVNSSSLNNMVAFDVDGHIRRFESVGEIMETFYTQRLTGYESRKESELARMDAELVELDARVRFVRAVVDGSLVVAKAEDDELLAGLKGLSLPPLSAPEDGDSLKAYEYLLRMRVDRLKAKAVTELEGELATIKASRDALAAKTAEQLWTADLNVFDAAYAAFRAAKGAARAQTVAESKGTGVKKVVRKAKVKA